MSTDKWVMVSNSDDGPWVPCVLLHDLGAGEELRYLCWEGEIVRYRYMRPAKARELLPCLPVRWAELAVKRAQECPNMPDAEVETLASAVYHAIIWIYTPEGHDAWSELRNALQDGSLVPEAEAAVSDDRDAKDARDEDEDEGTVTRDKGPDHWVMVRNRDVGPWVPSVLLHDLGVDVNYRYVCWEGDTVARYRYKRPAKAWELMACLPGAWADRAVKRAEEFPLCACDREVETLDQALESAFDWEKTAEGFEAWCDLAASTSSLSGGPGPVPECPGSGSEGQGLLVNEEVRCTCGRIVSLSLSIRGNHGS